MKNLLMKCHADWWHQPYSDAKNMGDQKFDTYKRLHHEKGQVLPLFLLAMSISACCMLLLTMNLSQVSRLADTVESYQHIQEDRQALRLYLQNIADAFDSHPLDIPYPLSHAAQFSQTFSLQGDRAAKIGTTAIRAFRTQFSKSMLVKEQLDNGTLLVCTALSAPTHYPTTVLGLSSTGSSMFRIRSRETERPGCSTISLQKLPHPFLPFDGQNLPVLLIPVVEEFAYYVDRKNTLRYLALFQGVVKENQPVRNLTISTRFHITYSKDYYSFVASIEEQSSIRMIARIPRIPVLDLILNASAMVS